MLIVACEEKYWDFILELRNNNKIKLGFISQEEIKKAEHHNFMKINNENYYICLYENTPAGFVGIVNNDIRFAVDERFQKKGIGNFLISFIKDKYPNAQAKVKVENQSSLKCFEKNSFKIKYYILELENEN
jgi:GNAT superfamily N-acetyltransferase